MLQIGILEAHEALWRVTQLEDGLMSSKLHACLYAILVVEEFDPSACIIHERTRHSPKIDTLN